MTVKSWGKGKPDYYKSTISSRPVILTPSTRNEEEDITVTPVLQARMITQKTYTISAGGTIIDTIYTVPTGYSLEFGGGFISVKDSCINKLRLLSDSEDLIGNFNFDMQGDFSLTSLTGQNLTEGKEIIAYVYNNDSMESEFSLLISGVLTKT